MVLHRQSLPRDAATLVIVERTAHGPRVLMGRRGRRAAFAPEVYVFPGGGVDPADATARPATPLDPAIAHQASATGDDAFATTLAMASVRETFEETGLLLAAPGDPGATGHESWETMRGMGLAPDLDKLAFLGRAITPRLSPIRFHARFFIADRADMSGEVADSDELTDLQWVLVENALHLPVIDVTEFMLGEVWRRARTAGWGAGRVPLFTYRTRQAIVRYL